MKIEFAEAPWATFSPKTFHGLSRRDPMLLWATFPLSAICLADQRA